MVDLLEIFVLRGTKFHGGSVKKFRSLENGISRWICWKFSFPGERNFSVESAGNFCSLGNEISRWICWKFSFPGERNFTVDLLEIFVPWVTKFHGGSVGNFRSPGTEFLSLISR